MPDTLPSRTPDQSALFRQVACTAVIVGTNPAAGRLLAIANELQALEYAPFRVSTSADYDRLQRERVRIKAELAAAPTMTPAGEVEAARVAIGEDS